MILLDVQSLIDANSGTRPQNKEVEKEHSDEYFCCAVCNTRVTPRAVQIQLFGQQIHIKRNPQGREFRFACFSEAPGCLSRGVPTSEHSWFDGYTWQFAHCRNCETQLGWYFNGEHSFYGLITEQLIECNGV